MASKLEILLEAERRGILPESKQGLLDEARKRGLVGSKEVSQPQEQIDPFKENVVRPLARTAKSMVKGAISIPELVSQPIGQVMDYGASKMGYDTNFGASPSQAIGDYIDEFTGGMTVPRNDTETVVDAAGEAIASGGNLRGLVNLGNKYITPRVAEALKKFSLNNKRDLLTFGGAGAGAEIASQVAPNSDIAPIIGSLLGGSVGAIKKPQDKSISSVEAFNRAKQEYSKLNNAKGSLSREAVEQIVDEAGKTQMTTKAGKALEKGSDLRKYTKKFEKLRDQNLTFQDALDIDKSITRNLDKFKVDGRLTEEGKLLYDAQTNIRRIIDDVLPDNKARQYWSKANKIADIESIISKSEGTAQPATSLRTGFRTLANNPKRMRGFSEKEAKLIKKASQPNAIVNNTLGLLGSRLNPIAAFAMGNNPLSLAAVSAGSAASRSGAEYAQLRRANKVLEELTKNFEKKGIKPEEAETIMRYLFPKALLSTSSQQ